MIGVLLPKQSSKWKHCIAERQQLPAVSAGASETHRVPAHIQRVVPARQQAHAHRPQAGEHPVCGQRLRVLLRV